MIVVISPSKTQDFSSTTQTNFSIPRQLDQSEQLIEQLIQLSPEDLAKLMKISEKLSHLNWQRFQSFKSPFSLENAKQALLAFKGDVYQGIDTAAYSDDDFKFAQQHLRVLSGLYGVLRPLDLMQPYRLEMGTRLENKAGKQLYNFWGTQITEILNQDLANTSPLLVNLASNEYFKAVVPNHLNAKILTLSFKENKQGIYKVVAIYAKRARGLMVNFIIKNHLTEAESLKAFKEANYHFNASLSTATEWVFSR
ncbi:MAG: peroxide stress protein YaaA [Methylococcales bacterium]|nr:peroxide stress protein YaaA [Methylococcales bacterium]